MQLVPYMTNCYGIINDRRDEGEEVLWDGFGHCERDEIQWGDYGTGGQDSSQKAEQQTKMITKWWKNIFC